MVEFFAPTVEAKRDDGDAAATVRYEDGAVVADPPGGETGNALRILLIAAIGAPLLRLTKHPGRPRRGIGENHILKLKQAPFT